MGTVYFTPQPTIGVWGSVVTSPSEKNEFYCFLSVSERLSLQRLLKINAVHSRPLVEKNGFAQRVCSDPLRQPRTLPRWVIFCSSCVDKLTKIDIGFLEC